MCFCAASCRASGRRGQVPAGAAEEPLRGEAVSHHQPGERGQPLDRRGPLSGDVSALWIQIRLFFIPTPVAT